MLSRVASLVYWMARYLERAENHARIVDVNAQLVIDMQSRRAAEDPKSWEPLVYVSGGDELFYKLYGRDQVTERNVVDFMLFDRRNQSSLFACVAQARENARCIRDQLPSEVWETLNTFYLHLKAEDYTRYAQLGASEYLGNVKSGIQLIYGTLESMVPRDESWWFFELGRYLERADDTSRILDVKYFALLPPANGIGSALDVIQWASVLRCCSAYEAFRRNRRGQLNLERVLDYLVLDREFPRSVRYSLDQAAHALREITAGTPHVLGCAPSRLLAELDVELDDIVIRDVIAAGMHEFLDDLQLKVGNVHGAVLETFIDYASATAAHVN